MSSNINMMRPQAFTTTLQLAYIMIPTHSTIITARVEPTYIGMAKKVLTQ